MGGLWGRHGQEVALIVAEDFVGHLWPEGVELKRGSGVVKYHHVVVAPDVPGVVALFIIIISVCLVMIAEHAWHVECACGHAQPRSHQLNEVVEGAVLALLHGDDHQRVLVRDGSLLLLLRFGPIAVVCAQEEADSVEKGLVVGAVVDDVRTQHHVKWPTSVRGCHVGVRVPASTLCAALLAHVMVAIPLSCRMHGRSPQTSCATCGRPSWSSGVIGGGALRVVSATHPRHTAHSTRRGRRTRPVEVQVVLQQLERRRVAIGHHNQCRLWPSVTHAPTNAKHVSDDRHAHCTGIWAAVAHLQKACLVAAGPRRPWRT